MNRKGTWVSALKNLSLVSQIGFSMVIPIVLCVLAGNYIDQKLKSQPWFLVIFVILGVGAAFLNLYKLTLTKKDKRK